MSSTTSPKKSVLITGCSAGGIGASLCFTFQKHGWLVFATARNTAKIPKDLTSLPNVEVVQLDVVDPKSITAAVGAVQKLLAERNNGSGLDMVINNSGVGLPGPMLHADIDKTKAMFDTNFFGVVRVTQAFMGLLIQAKGTLVNISSIAGEVPGPYECMPFPPPAPPFPSNHTTNILTPLQKQCTQQPNPPSQSQANHGVWNSNRSA